MIEKINPMFYVWGEKPTITSDEIATLKERFPRLPADYLELIRERSSLNVELIEGGKYIEPGSSENLYIAGLCSATQTLYAAETYRTVRRIYDEDNDAVVAGMDGGGSLFIYMNGDKKWGLYLVRLNDAEVTWVAPTLSDLLINGTGIEACLEHSYG